MNRLHDIPDDITAREAEALAFGLYIAINASGRDFSGKSYDPLTIDEKGVAHSYLFEMHDGGRHHEGLTPAQMCKYMIAQAVCDLHSERDRKVSRWTANQCYVYEWFRANPEAARDYADWVEDAARSEVTADG